MAEDYELKPPGNEAPAPEPEKKRRERRKRSLKIDKEAVSAEITKSWQADIDDRSTRFNRRQERLMQLQGILAAKDFPWENAANFHVPIMMIAGLKTAAVLENATKSIRPLIETKAVQQRNTDKQSRVNHLLDYQFFVENKGEKFIEGYGYNLIHEDAAFAFVPYVKDTMTVHDVRTLGELDPLTDHIPQLLVVIATMYKGQNPNPVMKDDEGWVWDVEYVAEENKKEKARLEFYERDDDMLEVVIIKKVTTFDGPCPQVLDFEDVGFPIRSANLQPPGPANPQGAPYVDITCNVSCDEIIKNYKNHTYDLLNKEDLEAILGTKSDTGSGSERDEQKGVKDELSGDPNLNFNRDDPDRLLIKRFGRWDVDRDGLEEDVIFWVFPKAKKLAKACLLSEMYPGIPVMRPIVSEAFIPIPNRVYGLSQDQLLLSAQEMTQISFDQHFDWGTITNTPMGFYRAASGLKPEQIYIEPGVLHPVDNPAQDINFPNWPTKDSSFAINTIALVQQYVERIQAFGDTSLGRIPQGKASAMRNVGTVQALLAQGAERPEQILRRFFSALSSVYLLMHRLNRRFLPKGKEFRIVGTPEVGTEFEKINEFTDVDFDATFEFVATLLNTNKQMMQQSLQMAISLIISPLAIQMGLTTPDKVYQLLADFLKSADLNVEKYMQKPPQSEPGPKLFAEEVIADIQEGKIPQGSPAEMPQEHLAKLFQFSQSDQYATLIQPHEKLIFQQWMMKIQGLVQQQMLMAQLAQTMQAGLQQGQNGNTPALSDRSGELNGNPKVQGNESIDETLQGGGIQ